METRVKTMIDMNAVAGQVAGWDVGKGFVEPMQGVPNRVTDPIDSLASMDDGK